MELNVFLIVMCMSHPPARVGVNYIYISYINIGHTVASNKYLLSCWWSEVTAGCTTASMVMWPTAETCDITLLSSPSRLWLTWCLELEAIFIFSNSKFLCGNLCNICYFSTDLKVSVFINTLSPLSLIQTTKKFRCSEKNETCLKVMAQHFHIRL